LESVSYREDTGMNCCPMLEGMPALPQNHLQTIRRLENVETPDEVNLFQ
jgi:hypothetical protein